MLGVYLVDLLVNHLHISIYKDLNSIVGQLVTTSCSRNSLHVL